MDTVLECVWGVGVVGLDFLGSRACGLRVSPECGVRVFCG